MKSKLLHLSVMLSLALVGMGLHAAGFISADTMALLPAAGLIGTTLGANAPRAYELGNRNEFPVIAADIIYEGAAVGLVDASGHAQPLAAANRFAGFAEAKADNSAGAAAAINVRVIESGKVQLAVTGAVITDVGQPVYASDDDTFSFVPTAKRFIGIVHRFVSSGVVVVVFDAPQMQDPYGGGVYETKAANYTCDAEDTGKTIFVDTDAVVITLPAIADGLDGVTIVNIAAFGAALVEIAPAAADKIHGPDITATDDKSLLNTKATARRGDLVTLNLGDADGYFVTRKLGTWAREA